MAYEEKTINQVATKIEEFSLSLLRKKVLSGIAIKIVSPFWGWIAVTAVNWVFDNFIDPFCEDLKEEGLGLIRKNDRLKRLKLYKEAPDEDFDESVDEFFGVPSRTNNS